MAKIVKYTVFNGTSLAAYGHLSLVDLGLTNNCSDLMLIATAKALLKSRFSKNKTICVRIE